MYMSLTGTKCMALTQTTCMALTGTMYMALTQTMYIALTGTMCMSLTIYVHVTNRNSVLRSQKLTKRKVKWQNVSALNRYSHDQCCCKCQFTGSCAMSKRPCIRYIGQTSLVSFRLLANLQNFDVQWAMPARRDACLKPKVNISSAFFKYSKNLTLTAINWTKAHGRRLKWHWNGGERYATGRHAKRSKWSDASCRMK